LTGGLGKRAVDIEALNTIHNRLLLRALGLYKRDRQLPRSFASVLKEYGLWLRSMEAEVDEIRSENV
jgi:hypothetical protein